ncbi:MAG: hypothetical protein EXS08_06250 [Planctomycetes bacterium]|nr:hypothetical protein [Planctomycetota bacterium]
MRTFPKELAEFRRVVEARGAELRGLPLAELWAAADRPTEDLVVQGRPATIRVYVQSRADGSLRVVVQGFMPGRLLRFVTNVALDGFCRRADGGVEELPEDELDKFG